MKMFWLLFFSRCKMEKQILGKIHGGFTHRICESQHSQVNLHVGITLLVKALFNDLSQQSRWVYSNYQLALLICVLLDTRILIMAGTHI